jgi:GT2 family glycosyltransferase
VKKVSIIIIDFNTGQILRDCLKNLEGIYSNLEIIVVNNGTLETSKIVSTEFPTVKLYDGENLGLAGGSNVGLKAADGDYLLYLGSDAFLNKDTLPGMIEYMEQNEDVGAATCKLVIRSGELDMDAHRGFPTPWAALTHFSGLSKLFPESKLFNQYFQGYKDLNNAHEIDLCISHFMLIRKGVFDNIGKWDEDYFLFGEDVDFCYRTKKAGWKIMYLPQWSAVHYKGSSIGIRKESADITKADAETKRRSRKNSVEAMKMFYEKHYKHKYNPIITNLVFVGIKFMGILRSFKNSA